MATITTRSGKGSALTHAEVDANFNNLNTDKVEKTAYWIDLDLRAQTADSNQADEASELEAAFIATVLAPDTTPFNQIRLVARVQSSSASANSPRLSISYATAADPSANQDDFTQIGTDSGDNVIDVSSTGFKKTAWMTIPSGASGTDIFFRCIYDGGDGVEDITIRSARIQLRYNA